MNDSELERFEKWSEPEPNSGCWLWRGSATSTGYGQLHVKGSPRKAHRLSYEHFKGRIPDGLQIDHLCRQPFCVNPDHLEAVTNRENTLRGTAGDAQLARTHCPSGHEYTESNTRRWRGRRHCKTCNRAAGARYRARKRREREQIQR